MCYGPRGVLVPGAVAAMRVLVFAVIAACLGACSLPANVAIRNVGEYRSAQDACLSGNLQQFEDAAVEASRIGQYVAMSCIVQTDKVLYLAIPNATEQERQAFRQDAERRATGYVLQGRGQLRG